AAGSAGTTIRERRVLPQSAPREREAESNSSTRPISSDRAIASFGSGFEHLRHEALRQIDVAEVVERAARRVLDADGGAERVQDLVVRHVLALVHVGGIDVGARLQVTTAGSGANEG